VKKDMGNNLPNAEKLCMNECLQLFTQLPWKLAASDTPSTVEIFNIKKVCSLGRGMHPEGPIVI